MMWATGPARRRWCREARAGAYRSPLRRVNRNPSHRPPAVWWSWAAAGYRGVRSNSSPKLTAPLRRQGIRVSPPPARGVPRCQSRSAGVPSYSRTFCAASLGVSPKNASPFNSPGSGSSTSAARLMAAQLSPTGWMQGPTGTPSQSGPSMRPDHTITRSGECDGQDRSRERLSRDGRRYQPADDAITLRGESCLDDSERTGPRPSDIRAGTPGDIDWNAPHCKSQ